MNDLQLPDGEFGDLCREYFKENIVKFTPPVPLRNFEKDTIIFQNTFEEERDCLAYGRRSMPYKRLNHFKKILEQVQGGQMCTDDLQLKYFKDYLSAHPINRQYPTVVKKMLKKLKLSKHVNLYSLVNQLTEHRFRFTSMENELLKRSFMLGEHLWRERPMPGRKNFLHYNMFFNHACKVLGLETPFDLPEIEQKSQKIKICAWLSANFTRYSVKDL
jgi:hypothetical protein